MLFRGFGLFVWLRIVLNSVGAVEPHGIVDSGFDYDRNKRADATEVAEKCRDIPRKSEIGLCLKQSIVNDKMEWYMHWMEKLSLDF